MAQHLMEALYGGGPETGNVTQFEQPSTRASADAQMPTGNTAYAVELGQTMAHPQSLNDIKSRITGSLTNPTSEPFNLHMMLIIAVILVGLIMIHRAFKGAVI
jgi:hypothetical protein